MIVGYLKLIGQKWREQINSERKYFFALVAVDHEDVIKAEISTELLHSIQKRKQRNQQEDARMEHMNAKMMREEIDSMKASLEGLHAKVAAVLEAAGQGVPCETKIST